MLARARYARGEKPKILKAFGRGQNFSKVVKIFAPPKSYPPTMGGRRCGSGVARRGDEQHAGGGGARTEAARVAAVCVAAAGSGGGRGAAVMMTAATASSRGCGSGERGASGHPGRSRALLARRDKCQRARCECMEARMLIALSNGHGGPYSP